MYTVIMNSGWHDYHFTVETNAEAIVLLDTLVDSFDEEASGTVATFSLIRKDGKEDNDDTV